MLVSLFPDDIGEEWPHQTDAFLDHPRQGPLDWQSDLTWYISTAEHKAFHAADMERIEELEKNYVMMLEDRNQRVMQIMELEAKLAESEKELAKWKDEYNNLCKFASDFQERLWKSECLRKIAVEALREVISEAGPPSGSGISGMCSSVAHEALEQQPEYSNDGIESIPSMEEVKRVSK